MRNITQIKKNSIGISIIIAFLCLPLACKNDTDSEGTQGDNDTSSLSKGGSDGDSDGDGDGDTDSDTDSDSDSDSDTDSDVDTESVLDGGMVEDGGLINRCAGMSESAKTILTPADLIIAVDNSRSMQQESVFVRDNLNRIAEKMSKLDVRIVLIAARKDESSSSVFLGTRTMSYGICVEPPLGKENACPDEDESNPPKFKHIDLQVDSTDGLQKILSTYDQWKDILREDAKRHFIVVSDDNSEMPADQFIDGLKNLGIEDFIFHAIVSSQDPGVEGPCNNLSAARGVVYENIVQQTNGVLGDLCNQDFDPVFDAIADMMIGTSISCKWDIPDPPEDETFDKNMVNLEFRESEKATHLIGFVSSKDKCKDVEHGWYYNKENNPTKIIVCPQTCEWIQGQADGEISIQFGCETKEAPPILQ